MLYNRENLHGGDIYKENIELDYSVNINPYGTPDEVICAMEESLRRIQNYPDPYCRELIKAIADYEGISPEYILCGNGAAELIYSYCRAIDAQTALIPAPSFSEYELGLKAAEKGCRIINYELKEENDFLLDRDFAVFIRENRPEAVFLCNPNNPTGRCISEDILKETVDCCEELSIKLFIDECFLELSDDRGISSLKNHEYKGIFILKAFTKNFGMAGVRLGYCICKDRELLMKMAEYTQPWNISIPAQAAGTRASKCRYFIEKACQIIPEERNFLMKNLKALGMKVIPSEANFILFKGPSGLDSMTASQGAAIRNCSNFEGLSGGWYRIAVKLHEENEKMISILKEVLKS